MLRESIDTGFTKIWICLVAAVDLRVVISNPTEVSTVPLPTVQLSPRRAFVAKGDWVINGRSGNWQIATSDNPRVVAIGFNNKFRELVPVKGEPGSYIDPPSGRKQASLVRISKQTDQPGLLLTFDEERQNSVGSHTSGSPQILVTPTPATYEVSQVFRGNERDSATYIVAKSLRQYPSQLLLEDRSGWPLVIRCDSRRSLSRLNVLGVEFHNGKPQISTEDGVLFQTRGGAIFVPTGMNPKQELTADASPRDFRVRLEETDGGGHSGQDGVGLEISLTLPTGRTIETPGARGL